VFKGGRRVLLNYLLHENVTPLWGNAVWYRAGGSAKVAKVLAFASFWHSVETTYIGLWYSVETTHVGLCIILAFC